MRNRLFGVVILVAASTPGFGQCAASGLQLGYLGTRLGDPFTLTLNGTPGVPGLLGVDAASGPVQTPIGTLCLGLTPVMQLVPFTFDAGGQVTLTGILPLLSGLHGASIFLQAAAVDPTQPTGTAVSNSAGVTFKSPRVYVIGGANSAWAWCIYDPLVDAVILSPVPLPPAYPYLRDAVLVPSLGWIAFALGSPTAGSVLWCVDASTGVPTSSAPIPGDPARVALDGTTVHILTSVAGSVPPLGIVSVSLPSGTVGPFHLLAPGDTPSAMLIPPSGGFAYLRCQSSIRIVNLVSGAELPPITVGGYATSTSMPVKEWILVGSTLYTHAGGTNFLGFFGYPALLDAIDTTVHAALHPAPVPLGFNGDVNLLRYGPGQFGNCLFFHDANNPTSPLMQINPATLTVINQLPGTPQGLSDLVPSPGGTEWLLMCNAPFPLVGGCAWSSPTLFSMKVPSMTVSTLAVFTPTPPSSTFRLVSIPSATLRRALVINDGQTVYPITTDLATSVTTSVPLPLAQIGGARVLVE